MASKPYLDKRCGIWYSKARLERDGPWKAVRLGKHDAPFPPSRPPKKPPAHVTEEWMRVRERERQVAAGTVRAERGLEEYVRTYAERYANTRGPNNTKSGPRLAHVAGLFLDFARSKGVATVAGVNRALCRDFLEDRAKSIGPNSVRTERALLSPVWSRAVEDEIIDVNPWKLCKAPGKKTEHVERFWTSEEINRIVAACNLPWQKNLVLVLANTGIRTSAVLAMRWGWVEWDRSLITIPPEWDKAGKGYQVALSKGARDAMQRMHAASRSDLLFPSPARKGKPMGYDTAKNFFNKAVARSGVPRGTLHDLRHTFARHLCETAPINAVQAALGHASLSMTARYSSLRGPNTLKYVEDFSIGTKEEG